MRKIFLCLTLFYIGQIATADMSLSAELTLPEALRLAEKQSPDLMATHDQEVQAEASLTIAKSYLYPSLELSAVQSFGFAGSSSPTPPEFGGLLNSPYRVGPAVGLLGKMTLLDLSNWDSVDAAGAGIKSAQEHTKVMHVKVIENALSAFLEAARLRGEVEVWKRITTKIEAVEKTVKGFVKTGQFSDVSRLLIQDQADEARMNQMTFEERYRQGLRRLSLLTGLDEKTISCPMASELNERDLGISPSDGLSPLVAHAKSEVEVAKSQASQASSKHLPKLYAIASAGYLDDSRIVEKQNYSVWVGVTLPIFEGFRISSEAQRARAILAEKENRLLATKLDLDESNARLDETISVCRSVLKALEHQHESAVRAFDLARQRYLAFLGPVVELRETLRNLVRIESQMNDKKAELLLAVGSKNILNGGALNAAVK